MKKMSILLIVALSFLACKQEKKEEKIETSETITEKQQTTKKVYPAAIAAVLDAHGGIEQWNKMNNLCFEIKGGTNKETHTVSLKDRKSKVETKKWTIGNDGNDVWLLENEENAYEGNARFYHNLMFYFYAMPFVISDDGIVYTQMEAPMELDGKTYNATKIAYNAGIGDSPKDEYIIFSDPTTNKMEWLGYTVTYGKEQQGEDWHYIKYDKWETVNGLLLPKKLTWYNVKDNKPADERNDLNFDNIIVSETELESSTFSKPEAAIVAKK